MTQPIDITGKRFGRLVAISKVQTGSPGTAWLCRCDCGNEKVIRTGSLTSGRTRSCGCISKKADLSGMVFGELTVLRFDGYYKRNPKWLCKCSCGKVISVFENGLKCGKSTHCGSPIHTEIIGKRFGRLTVLPEIQERKNNSMRKYLCRCDCGNYTWVTSTNLTSGNTRSCGCLSKEMIHTLSRKHGMSQTRIYNIWRKMISRCEKEYDNCYKRYGAVGISVCEEWHNFENFYKWSMENGYNDHMTIDRINGQGNYEPSNCRWVSYKVQANNLKTNIIVEYKGEQKTLSQWADDYGIPYKTLHQRYRINHWDFERALTQPLRKSGRMAGEA